MLTTATPPSAATIISAAVASDGSQIFIDAAAHGAEENDWRNDAPW
ncbi:hypothetical protein DJICPGNB_18150 [Escherichia coli]|nr:hypothetical protein DJICPGNB_18150 [Escherichia coli]